MLPNPLQKNQTTGNPIKSHAMAGLGAFCAFYLANPGWGLIDFIPDNLPIIGNFDEAVASLLLLRVLAYFGINLVGIGGKNPPAQGRVIDIDGPGK
ncbi:MAG: DUF1232 domain-containing protein [Verrucomicrobiales bacterium]